ncbi:VOC family protein [Robertkochia flava]|uniref:VOC family protein n=1 Tax=Robertkochia flava TaxID=3447986 RepID=UPI001CCD0B4E|nr:VOC family protein [Robertkochia marina]
MVAWFEIPVTQMERAQQFYETVLEISINLYNINGLKMGWFPGDGEGAPPSGALIQHESYIPSKEGVLIYFSCPDIEKALSKVEKAGGEIYQPKTMISDEYGFMGVFIDSEGNRVALHSSS